MQILTPRFRTILSTAAGHYFIGSLPPKAPRRRPTSRHEDVDSTRQRLQPKRHRRRSCLALSQISLELHDTLALKPLREWLAHADHYRMPLSATGTFIQCSRRRRQVRLARRLLLTPCRHRPFRAITTPYLKIYYLAAIKYALFDER